MNNRYETPYRLQRPGLGEIIVGWERVYELTPGALMDKVQDLSFTYDRAIAFSFPEYWKREEEAYLPALILNNIFGIVPYYSYNGGLTWVRVVNLATNETIKDYPGTKDDLLYICKHILTDCKKVLRSWGKEQFREFRYGQEYLRDRWHKENYQDAFQRLDVRLYSKMRYNRLTEEECYKRAEKAIKSEKKDWTPGEYKDDEMVYRAIKEKLLSVMSYDFLDYAPEDVQYTKEDQERLFSYLFDKDLIVSMFHRLVYETNNDYTGITYASIIANAIRSGVEHF